jgi:hypothetical protein
MKAQSEFASSIALATGLVLAPPSAAQEVSWVTIVPGTSATPSSPETAAAGHRKLCAAVREEQSGGTSWIGQRFATPRRPRRKVGAQGAACGSSRRRNGDFLVKRA